MIGTTATYIERTPKIEPDVTHIYINEGDLLELNCTHSREVHVIFPTTDNFTRVSIVIISLILKTSSRVCLFIQLFLYEFFCLVKNFKTWTDILQGKWDDIQKHISKKEDCLWRYWTVWVHWCSFSEDNVQQIWSNRHWWKFKINLRIRQM